MGYTQTKELGNKNRSPYLYIYIYDYIHDRRSYIKNEKITPDTYMIIYMAEEIINKRR